MGPFEFPGDSGSFSPATAPVLFGAQTLTQRFMGRPIPHSILLFGPQGVGKTTFAYHLARYLFQGDSENFQVDPEGALFAQVAAGAHGDFRIIQRSDESSSASSSSASRDISVDQIRSGIHFLRHTSLEGGWRILIIDGADDLPLRSANALLKTLEEPSTKTLLILIAHSLGRVLPTLQSRCQRYEMTPLSDCEMDRALAFYFPSLSDADAVFFRRYAKGRLGQAMRLAALGGQHFYADFLKAIEGIAAHDLRPGIVFMEKLLGGEGQETLFKIFGVFFTSWLAFHLKEVFSPSNNQKTKNPSKVFSDYEESLLSSLFHKHSFGFWTEFCTEATEMLTQKIPHAHLDRRQGLLCLLYEMMSGEKQKIV